MNEQSMKILVIRLLIQEKKNKSKNVENVNKNFNNSFSNKNLNQTYSFDLNHKRKQTNKKPKEAIKTSEMIK